MDIKVVWMFNQQLGEGVRLGLDLHKTGDIYVYICIVQAMVAVYIWIVTLILHNSDGVLIIYNFQV